MKEIIAELRSALVHFDEEDIEVGKHKLRSAIANLERETLKVAETNISEENGG